MKKGEEGENWKQETPVRVYYIDDVVDIIVWKYSAAPLLLLCKERQKEPARSEDHSGGGEVNLWYQSNLKS